MRDAIKKSVSFILTLAIVFGFTAPAFTLNNALAYEGQSIEIINENIEIIDEIVNIEALKELFATMSPEAIEIYESSLTEDKEQLDFYVQYINPDFEPQDEYMDERFATNPISNIQVGLTALGFNFYIRTGFTAIASGIVAALADGPLLVGDTLGAVLAGGGFLIIALNWDTIAPKWNQVVNLFKKEFSAAAGEIVRLFDKIKARASVHKAEKKTIKEALKKADSDENKQGHIMPPNPKHNWWKLVTDTITWKKVRPYVEMALENGVETLVNPNKNVYRRTLKLETGHKVVVEFKKMTETLWRIGTAWVE